MAREGAIFIYGTNLIVGLGLYYLWRLAKRKRLYSDTLTLIAVVMTLAALGIGSGFLAVKDHTNIWVYFGLLLVTAAAVANLSAYRRFSPRRCRRCAGRMILLDERADGKLLDQGERAEEALKSVDYDVWVCSKCRRIEKIAHRSVFSRYSRCPKCGRRAFATSETVITRATTHSPGLARVDGGCPVCGYQYHGEREIPMTTPDRDDSDSSGSRAYGGSSGGSSGQESSGGTSGGGGASRGW